MLYHACHTAPEMNCQTGEDDERYDELTPEDLEYSALLTVLIEEFEDAHYALAGSTPTAGCAV